MWPAAAEALTVAWDLNTDGVTAGYYVTVGLTPGAPLAVFDVGQTSTASLPLPMGSRYYVAVGGYSADRSPGPPSVEIEVDLSSPPGRPENLAASVSGASVSLSWTRPGSGGIPSGYLLSAGTSPGASDLVSGVPVGAQTTVSGALPPGRYYARIHAANHVGVGPASGEVTFQVGGTAPLNPPRELDVSWNGRHATFSWEGPSGGGATSYVLEAGSGPGLANIGAIDIGNTTSFSIVVPPGTFYVRVRAAGAAGLSAPSNEIVIR